MARKEIIIDNQPRNEREVDNSLVKKAKRKTTSAKTVRSISTLETKINAMRENVEQYLGDKRDDFLLISNYLSMMQYASECVDNGICAIDTETTSLDTFTCQIVGFSLYTPNQKPCYIPINHVDYITNERVDGQLTESQVKRCLSHMVEHKVKFVFFNADYDIRVIRHTIGVDIPAYFDCYIGARMLNENEPDNGLKALHKKYVLEDKEDAFSFSQLFEKIPFNLVPINTAYLYAARDALVTYELYEFQLPFLTSGTEECKEQELEGVQYVFWNIEMPIVSIMADIEDRGIAFDFGYQKILSEKYNEQQRQAEEKFYADLKKYTENWYSISSPKQLATLFYDDLKLLEPLLDTKTGKVSTPTDVEALSSLHHELADDILAYRANAKLISTYIDKMKKVAERDGRVHCLFNQVGTDTGRFSSRDPNLQNIPSHNLEIRKMFVASEGHVLIGADFSAQEVRMVAHLCGDPKMIQAYKDGKDLYCEVASLAFQVPYDECKEFRSDGTLNKEGKARRSQAKAIVLGILYGKGTRAIAEDLHITVDRAKEIYASVMYAFPDLEKYERDSKQMARDCGYVTTLFGRKRRLPDIQLPRYEIIYRNGTKPSRYACTQIASKLDKLWFEDRKKAIAEYAKDGIIIKDNGGFIARAERQCVNARVQGSSGEQVKLAIYNLATDEELNKLGFKVLLTIHDEVIGECPIETAKQASERFKYIMEHTMDDYMVVPSKCDLTISRAWYGDEIKL